jgi:hypothetical protein
MFSPYGLVLFTETLSFQCGRDGVTKFPKKELKQDL